MIKSSIILVAADFSVFTLAIHFAIRGKIALRPEVIVFAALQVPLYTHASLRTVFGECTFLFSGPKAWNALPDRFHLIESTDSLKKQLKSLLFNHSV